MKPKQKKRAISFTPLPAQRPFMQSRKPKAYLSMGFGGGKTYSLCMKGFQLMDLNPGIPGGLLAPTLKMYKRDVRPTILEICRDNGIPYQENRADGFWEFPDANAQLYIFHSEDDGASIRGPNLGWGLINEVSLVSKDAFLAFLSRLRHKRSTLIQCAMSGTPEGFNWAYEYFIENPREDTDLIYGDARQNTHVSGTYFKMLEESYDPLMQEMYIGGKYLNLTGKRCVYAFDRRIHTEPDIEKIPGAPVWVSLDFNVTPMAATLWNPIQPNLNPRVSGNYHRKLQAFDEIRIDASNTYEVCDAIKSKVNPDDEVVIYPDPAGAARSTKTRNVSDIDILRSQGFENIKYGAISVRDALNATNAIFAKNQVVLNSKRCRNAIADLEQCVFREGVFEIDKSNPMRSHWLDGIKNMVHYEFPIRVGRGFTQQAYR